MTDLTEQDLDTLRAISPFDVRKLDALYLATALMAAQRKIDALQKHATALAGLLAMPEVESKAWLHEQQRVLANWTAYLIDGGKA